eukprot:128821_1
MSLSDGTIRSESSQGMNRNNYHHDPATNIILNVIPTQTHEPNPERDDIDMIEHTTISQIIQRTASFDYTKYVQKTKTTHNTKMKMLYRILPDQKTLHFWFDHDRQQTKVNKSWIRKSRITLLEDIMSKLMGIDTPTMDSMNTTEKRERFAAELGMKLVIKHEDDETILEMIEVVHELRAQNELALSLVMDDVDVDDYLGQNIYIKIVFAINELPVFRMFAESLWLLLCDKFISLESFKKWDDWIIELLYQWPNVEFWKENENMHEFILKLEQYFTRSRYKDHFSGFVSSFIVRGHDAFIRESRNIIIRNLYITRNITTGSVNVFQSASFGGAALNTLYKKILRGPLKGEKETLLPYADVLSTEAKLTEDIPSRLNNENRGYMRLLNPAMYDFVNIILEQLKNDVMFYKKVSQHFSLQTMRAQIINSIDNQELFYNAFVSVLSNSHQHCDIHLDILDLIYDMFSKAILSKASWSILRKSAYKADAVPLRQQQKSNFLNKIKNRNKGQVKLPFGK